MNGLKYIASAVAFAGAAFLVFHGKNDMAGWLIFAGIIISIW